MAGNLSCKQFTDFLIRRSEHLDENIIKDITPTDGWIGHVATGDFPALDGISHTFDRIARVYPDLSGAWEDVAVDSCITTSSPCDPVEKKIGFGSIRDSYKLQRKSYGTDLFCFDLIMSADRAKEQFAGLVSSLKDAANVIISDRLRFEAFGGANITRYLAGASTLTSSQAFTPNSDNTQLTCSTPSSKLTMPMLQRQVQPLMLNGALGANIPGVPMFELVTDLDTAWALREGNPELANKFRFQDFVKGGDLYKYGITDAVGNFAIRIDPFPIRYQVLADGTLNRVFPYKNIAATAGIKGVVNQAYIDAPIQVSFIWNRQAMRSLVRNTAKINEMMPFAARDFAGKWQFVMDNLGADSNGCVIENTRRNKGKFIADFSFATKWERPEWVIAFIHLREQMVVADVPNVAQIPAYVAQSYSSANSVCTAPVLVFTPTPSSGLTTYSVSANTITCNGVPIVHTAIVTAASIAALATALTSQIPSLGTWAAAANGTDITLTGSTCNQVAIPFV